MSCAVTLENVGTCLGQQRILDRLDLKIPAGRVTVIMGESGSGKSTLLRTIAGLQPIETGSIHFDEEAVTDLPAHRRGAAMAFQGYALYPRQSVARNLELPLVAGLSRADRRRLWRRHLAERLARWPALARRLRDPRPDALEVQVGGMLERLGIGPLALRPVEQLSGGEQQRVALGRALIRRPRVLLLDEPLSNVDPARQQEIVALLHELFERYRPTTVLVTHDWQEAVLLGETIAILQDGRICQHGPPQELYDEPRDLRVLAFSQQGLLNRIPDLALDSHGRLLSPDGKVVVEPSEALPPGRYEAIFRAEHLKLAGPNDGWTARIRSARPAAAGLFLDLEAAGRRWSVVSEPGTVSADQQLRLRLMADRGWIADTAGQFVARLRTLEVRS